MRAWPAAPVQPAALSNEWLLGNSLGDLSSGAVSGAQVRPFHAAFVAADPSASPVPVVLRLDGRITDSGQTYEMGWRTDPHARGLPPADLLSFEHRPWPTWRFRAGAVTVEQRLLLIHDRHALVVSYRHIQGPPARVTVTPAFGGPPDTPPTPHLMPGRVRFTFPGAWTATVWHNGGFMPSRGADRPPYVPGFIEAPLGERESLLLVVSTDEHLLRDLAESDRLGTPAPKTLAGCVAAIEKHERSRLDTVERVLLKAANATAQEAYAARHPDEKPPRKPPFAPKDPWLGRLARGIEMGFTSGQGDSITRAAPGGWRDGEAALRSVRGLVALRSFERAQEILLGYGQLVREGLVPSGFDFNGKPLYEAAEPALWFVIATELFARRSGEAEFVKRALAPAVEQVIERYREGTQLGIAMAADGLLVQGEDRSEKRADLNALWYAAQAAAGQLVRSVGRKQHAAFYLAWAREHQTRFNELMWDEKAGGLLLAMAGDEVIRGCRPSHALAASLLPPLLAPERAQRLMDRLERELYTPAGMRDAPESNVLLTEWLEPFLTGWLRAHGRGAEPQERIRASLEEIGRAADEYAAGHIPERFKLVKADDPDPADAERDGGAAQIELPMGGRLSAGPRYAGRPVSVLASMELMRLWIEELDHPA